uniref:DUF569 domain-containing protein n=1 Tax=Oryza meridionalis TaxID=40149 RepID=A0A0E0DXD6_9ORYZ
MTSSSMWARRPTCQRTRGLRPHLSAKGDNSFKLRPPWLLEPRAVTVATTSSPPSALPSPEHQETKSAAPPLPLAHRSSKKPEPRAASASRRSERQETRAPRLLRRSPEWSAKKPRTARRLRRSPEAMEQFHDGHHVWLRSRANGLYLCADDDRSGVSLQQDRASVHAAWAVHILHFNGGDVLMLHSAANGRYLAAYRAEGSWNRRDLNRLPSLTFSWYALGSRYGDDVLLRHFKSMFFLRALFRRDRISNSGGVGVCAMDRGTRTMQWVVEAIPPRESVPTLPDPLC